MSEEEVVVTPLGSGHNTVEDKLSDQGSLATSFLWLVPSKDLVEARVGWDGTELPSVGKWVGAWEVGLEHGGDIGRGLELKGEWESQGGFLSTRLVELGEV